MPDPQPRHLQPWYCEACERHRGVAARSILHLVMIGGVKDSDETITGGRWVFCCFPCMARDGKMTIAGRPVLPGDMLV